MDARHRLHARHDVVQRDLVDVLRHGLALLRLPGDPQLRDQELDGAPLDEDREEDDDERGEEEHVLLDNPNVTSVRCWHS